MKNIKLINKTLVVLKEAKVILYPTDTVWGIGCDATQETAVNKIFKIKKRSESKSLIVLVSNIEMLENYVIDVPVRIKKYLKSVNQPVTIIYKASTKLAKNVIAKDGTVAIRIVSNGFCNDLIKNFKKPIVSTSANLATFPTPSSFNEIDDVIKQKVAFIVDFDKNNISSKPSKIIKFEGDKIRVLRK